MKLRFFKRMFAEKVNEMEAGCLIPEVYYQNILSILFFMWIHYWIGSRKPEVLSSHHGPRYKTSIDCLIPLIINISTC